MRIILAFIFICIINVSASTAQSDWFLKIRQVNLLTTSKQEVEKLFNSPNVIDISEWSGRSKTVEYKLKEGRLSVTYSLGKCSDSNTEGYDVSEEVVIDFRMKFNKDVRLKSTGLDVSKFERRNISDLPALFTYANTDYSEHFNGTLTKLQDYSRSPSKKQESLSCKKRL